MLQYPANDFSLAVINACGRWYIFLETKKKAARFLLPPKAVVRYSMPKNFFCSSHKIGNGCLHFSTPIWSNCPVRTPWMISGKPGAHREFFSLPRRGGSRSRPRGILRSPTRFPARPQRRPRRWPQRRREGSIFSNGSIRRRRRRRCARRCRGGNI